MTLAVRECHNRILQTPRSLERHRPILCHTQKFVCEVVQQRVHELSTCCTVAVLRHSDIRLPTGCNIGEAIRCSSRVSLGSLMSLTQYGSPGRTLLILFDTFWSDMLPGSNGFVVKQKLIRYSRSLKSANQFASSVQTANQHLCCAPPRYWMDPSFD